MSIFSDAEKARIQKWDRSLIQEMTLRWATADHPLDGRFREAAGELAELAPHIKLKKDGDAPVSRPTLFVGRHTAYQALPVSRELQLFLDSLSNPKSFTDRVSEEARQKIADLQVPALVKVYITPHCPHCPAAVAMLLGLAEINDQVRVSVIDGELFPEAAQEDRIGAAPTILLDDQFRWTGSVDALELVTLMLDRDPASLGADALRGLIEDGDAERVARMMIDAGKLFPGFFKLLAHPRWSVRLGAMVAFETLAEVDGELAGRIVDPLIELFPDVDNMVQGDLLHVIGESGNPAALPFLRDVAEKTDDEEVRAAADEAMENLQDE